MGKEKKSFKLFDSVLMSVVVILVVEAAAPSAAIGNSQFFWWILLFLLFFVPYGLISAELGTTYEDNGGMYDWVKRAYGHKMGTRVAWYYWINFPLWMASLAVLFSSTILQIIGIEVSTPLMILMELTFIIIVNVVGSLKISESKWVLNVAALFKVFIILSLGGIALYVAITKGSVNTYSLASFLPDFSFQSISFVSVIIFNFLGFEVVTTLSSEMKEPKKQIPKAIILGGVLITIFYFISAFGIGSAISVETLSVSSGLLDSFALLLGTGNGWFITIIGILFVGTLFANLISWSLGINYVACYAAKDEGLPKIFAMESKQSQAPIGAALMNGIVSSVLVLASHLIPNQDMFWSFFALNMMTLLFSYVFIFPSFLRLRKIDAQTERVFKVPGGDMFIKWLSIVPMLVLIIAMIFAAVPLSNDPEELAFKLPLLGGTVVAVIVGELLVLRRTMKNKKYSGEIINEET